jgi:2-C-methyl-D-erythritol 2,4-cyclodiphosphate synthase
VTPQLPPTTTHVGVGYDSHRFAPGGAATGATVGRPLVIAGVVMPGDTRVIAHSDGDVAAHAVTDAVLGAAGLGDIGELFPNSDAANAGRDSMEMLRLAVQRVRAAGWNVVNVDVAVIAERHRVGPHRAAMRQRLAGALQVPADAVFVKGKTNEGLGWIGQGEGLAAHAVASLVRAGG